MSEKQVNILAWIGSLIASMVAFTAFAFTTFETKANAEKEQSRFDRRLDKIDEKLDQIYRGIKQ